jgi:hypothetical protein
MGVSPMIWIFTGVSPADDLCIKLWRDAHATSNPDFTSSYTRSDSETDFQLHPLAHARSYNSWKSRTFTGVCHYCIGSCNVSRSFPRSTSTLTSSPAFRVCNSRPIN